MIDGLIASTTMDLLDKAVEIPAKPALNTSARCQTDCAGHLKSVRYYGGSSTTASIQCMAPMGSRS